MPSDDEDKELGRNRRTLFLLLGGAASLMIPLLAVMYIHYRDAKASVLPGAASSLVFEHRGSDGSTATQMTPSSVPAPDTTPGGGSSLAQVPNMPLRASSPAPIQPDNGLPQPQGGSLSFVKGSSDYYQDKTPAQPAAAPAAAVPPPAPAPAAAAAPQQVAVNDLAAKPTAKASVKPAQKAWNRPHLQGGFGTQAQKPAAGGPGGPGGQGGPPAGTPDMSQLMKNMPQGGAGMPDMSSLMKGMPQGGAGAPAGGMPGGGAPGAAPPDMSQMMQQMGQKK